MRPLDEIAYDLLKRQIEEHNEGKCSCDLTDGGYGLCFAEQWLEGVVNQSSGY